MVLDVSLRDLMIDTVRSLKSELQAAKKHKVDEQKLAAKLML